MHVQTMAVFRNRKEKRYVEKGLVNTGEATFDAATRRPVGAARHAYKAGQDFDKAYKAAKEKSPGSPKRKNAGKHK